MKKIVPLVAIILTSVIAASGQGRVNFNNVSSGNPVVVFPFGDYAGANYSIQLLWAAGTYNTYPAFAAANPSSGSPVSFFGGTGSAPAHGPTVDGAGLFDGGIISIGPAGIYTMLARGWFNGGQYPTYQAAQNAAANTGLSQLFTMSVTAPPVGANDTFFPSFVIGIPEPSTFALLGLGVILLMFRRCKKREQN
jgi:hypothetical protein